VHVPTVKPLDNETIVASAKRTGRVLTAEEAQVAAGFGGAIAELLGDQLPTPLIRVGMQDRFGESGEPLELFDFFKMTGQHIADKAEEFIRNKPQYHR
jgi:transketolase